MREASLREKILWIAQHISFHELLDLMTDEEILTMHRRAVALVGKTEQDGPCPKCGGTVDLGEDGPTLCPHCGLDLCEPMECANCGDFYSEEDVGVDGATESCCSPECEQQYRKSMDGDES